MGNGELFRRGIGKCCIKLGYLSEAYTEFSFAMISEELGFMGAIDVLGLIFFNVYRAFTLASRTTSYFYKLVCVGIASYIALQALINLGG
ncbi:FtsW/RodA/SpoVE family cell cycle protein, partial [Staphylococcus felis]|uniref:FtsW/RodA/SpoVE family cell cycle protein n=1 Tax=Staphylococcus felis TaxID=46127 RepID=UPI00237C3974